MSIVDYVIELHEGIKFEEIFEGNHKLNQKNIKEALRKYRTNKTKLADKPGSVVHCST